MLFIHPGFAKTATTTLQHQVFAKHPQIELFSLPTSRPEIEWAIDHLCHADSIFYDEDRVRTIFRESMENASSKTVVLSYEHFVLYESKDKGMVAQRLYKLFPDARIFFTIRRQEDLVASLYLTKIRKYIKGKNFLSFIKYFRIKKRALHRSIFDDIRFFEIIEYYAKVFGRDRIKILLFEKLTRDTRQFADELSEFLQVDQQELLRLVQEKQENPTISQNYVNFWRHVSPFLPAPVVRKGALRTAKMRGRRAEVDIGPEAREMIVHLCGEGNRRLAETYGIDLASYGYCMAPEPDRGMDASGRPAQGSLATS
jgi:hypothetical protein